MMIPLSCISSEGGGGEWWVDGDCSERGHNDPSILCFEQGRGWWMVVDGGGTMTRHGDPSVLCFEQGRGVVSYDSKRIFKKVVSNDII